MKSISYISGVGRMVSLCLVVSSGIAIFITAETLNIAVASNFTPTLKLLQPEFEKASGHTLQIISGSSGAHYAQIINGAPFDLFLSADTERPEALARAGLVTPEQRRIYAFGRLALWSRDKELGANLDILSNLAGEQKVALANPRLAPYGAAAEASLRSLGIYEQVKEHLVVGENVGQAFQFAFSGSAILGFVAYSQVLNSPVQGSFTLIADTAYEPIAQEMVLLLPSAAGQTLFDFLSSPAVIDILEQAGYYAPQGRAGRN